MKKLFLFLLLLLIGLAILAQEKQGQNLKLANIEYVYAYWVGLDRENNIFKVKTEDKIIEFKYEKNKIKIFGKQKNMKITDFKEGDFVKILYKVEEGVNIAKRIVKDPKKSQDTTPSPSGN